MKLLTIVLGIAIVLASASTSAAGKRRPGKHRVPNRATPAATKAPEPAPMKASNGQTDARPSENRAPARGESVRQESRIEFDERMLRGQSAAGVIYLFQRTPSDWKSIVEVPGSFRPRTVDVLAPVGEKQ